jgi:hypothetical protein
MRNLPFLDFEPLGSISARTDPVPGTPHIKGSFCAQEGSVIDARAILAGGLNRSYQQSLCLSTNKHGRENNLLHGGSGRRCRAMQVRDCHSKESVFAVSRICSITALLYSIDD